MNPYEQMTTILDHPTSKNLTEAEFKMYLFKEYGLSEHPRVEDAYRLAYRWGHAGGFYQVLDVFDELSILLKE